jgi:CDP-6-deoxy-D-xylo-4-hexulose-3-dehydrase
MSNNITRDDLDLLIDYLKQTDPKLTHGPKVLEFEAEWSKWLGVKHSVMFNSGASANDITMLALAAIDGRGEVIVPPLTWVSDIASVLHAGHEPIFVDINPSTLACDENKIINAITPDTKAVFLTHVLGFNGLSDFLIDSLKSQNIKLIEDVCESHGATYKGRKIGTFGWASNFSFYYAHHMTTIEGGMISTNDSDLYEVLRIMRSHGMVRESTNLNLKLQYTEKYPNLNPDFIFAYASHNMRPSELNAILGLSQIKRLDKNNSLRTRNFKKFLDLIDPKIFKTTFNIEGSSNYAFTLVLQNPNFILRDQIELLLKKIGVEFRRGLSGGGNQLRQPYLENIARNFPIENFPQTEHIHNFSWYIGNFPDLESEKIEKLGLALSQLAK